MKYNAHINLEACTSMKCVKYLYKYVYKGHDCANVVVEEILHHDEIQTGVILAFRNSSNFKFSIVFRS